MEHPVRNLMDEHEVILQVLVAIDRKATEPDGGPIDEAFWRGALEFIADFADRRHHHKEEEQLFPALAEHGMHEQQGPLAVMRHEHEQARELTARLRRAVDDGDRGAVARAAAGYAFLLREHIQKENMVLFEMARQMLPAPAAAELLDRFAAADRADDRSAAEWIAFAEDLCSQAGAEFRAPAPAAPPAFEV